MALCMSRWWWGKTCTYMCAPSPTHEVKGAHTQWESTHTYIHPPPHTHIPPRVCPVRWHPPQFLTETFSRRCYPQHPPVMWWRNLYAEETERSIRYCGHDNDGHCHMINQIVVSMHLTAVPPFVHQVMTRSVWRLPRWSGPWWDQCSVWQISTHTHVRTNARLPARTHTHTQTHTHTHTHTLVSHCRIVNTPTEN